MKKKNFLWNVLSFFMAATLSVGFLSCGDDANSEQEPDPEVNKPTLSVEKTSIILDSNDSNTNIAVTVENTGWSVNVTKGSDWLSANKNGTSVSISAKENTNTDDREGAVVVTATSDPNLISSIIVTQKGAKGYITVNGTNSAEYTFLGYFDNEKSGIDYVQTFKIKSNVTWTLSGNVDWLNVSATSGNGEVDLNIYPTSENPTSTSRTAELSLSGNGADPVTINITQLSVKRIVKMIEEEGSSIYESTFSYDSQGRVVKVVTTQTSGGTNNYSEKKYQYGELLIITKEVEGLWSESHTYTLENGLIVKDVEVQNYNGGYPSSETTLYSYDSNRFMTSMSYSGDGIESYKMNLTWVDENLTNLGEREFTYTNIPWNKGMFFYFKGSNMDSFLWPAGFWGKTPKNMPYQNKDYNYTYEYIETDGLVTQMKIVSNDTGKVTYITTLFWE